MKVLKCAEMRRIDRKTISNFKIPAATLMERAGIGVAEAVRRLMSLRGESHPRVEVVAGYGNNGGDAFVTARHLRRMGMEVEVILAGSRNLLKGDALMQYENLLAENVIPRELPGEKEWEEFSNTWHERIDVVVDGVLGIGAVGPVRSLALSAIRHIKRRASRAWVVSIDVPSGLDADTGEPLGEAVVADLTVTLGLPKIGLTELAAIETVGSVEVADLGFPETLVTSADSERSLVTAQDVRAALQRRLRDTHKGTYGHVLVIGGARGFAGAVAMAAEGAARAGAGRVTVMTPKGVASTVAGLVPEAMVHAACETPEGSLSAQCVEEWTHSLEDFDIILAGPGLTVHEQSRLLVGKLLSRCRKPLILDADALNVCGGRPDLIKRAVAPVVITPHLGEMARLLGKSVAVVQQDRIAAALESATRTGAVTVLKGAGTVIAAEDFPPWINLTGNPGMATGGTGDVLGGIIAGMISQKLSFLDAACVGVYLHGCAGDRAAWRASQSGLIARDLLAELPAAIREAVGR